MSERSILPAAAVAALVSAIAGEARAGGPMVRLPDAGHPFVMSTPGAQVGAQVPSERAQPELRLSPVDALLRQAKAWRHSGRDDLAEKSLRRALEIAPNNPEALYAMADLARGRGQDMAAAIWTGRLSAAQPHDPRLAELKAGPAPPAAIHHPHAPAPQVARAARVAPQDPSGAIRAEGFTALNAGEVEPAEQLFERALAKAPADADAAGGLGVVRLRQRRFDDALGLLSRAVKGPHGSDWREAQQTAAFFAGLGHARAAAQAGRLAQAEAAARTLAATPSPRRIEAELLLGEIHNRQGKPAAAEQAYRAALTVAPDRTEARLGLALALTNQGKADEAHTLAQSLPDGADRRTLLARIDRARAASLQANGDLFGAGAALQSSLDANPQDPWTRYDYAKFLAAQGDSSQAQAVLQPLAAPDADTQALTAAALFAQSQGRSDEAAALIGRIPESRRGPDIRALADAVGVDAAVRQARALQAQGQSARAVLVLRERLNQGPVPFAAKARLAEALYDLGDVYQAGALSLAAANTPLPADAHAGDGAGFVSVLAAAGQESLAEALLAKLAQRAATAEDQAAVRGIGVGYAIKKADRLRTAGDLAGAFDVLSAAYSAAPGDVGLMTALARVCQAGGMQAQAAQIYDALLARSPGDRATLLAAAQAAAAGSDYDRAERYLGQAIRLAPADADLYYELGRMERARGHEGAAFRAFQKAESLIHGPGLRPTPAAGLFQPNGALGPNPFAATRPAQGALNIYDAPTAFSAPGAQVSTGRFLPAMLFGGGAGARTVSPPSPFGSGYSDRDGSGAPRAGGQTTPVSDVLFATAPPDAIRRIPADDAPLSQRLDHELSDLQEDRGFQAQFGTDARVRTGDAGTSRLSEISTTATLSSPSLGGGRLSFSVRPIGISAGTSGGQVAEGVGTAPLVVADGIVAKAPVVARSVSPRAAGVGLDLAYASKHFAVDVGTTPLGFGKPRIVGGVQLTPTIGDVTLKVGADRRAVTDSVLSYAGMTDPYTGKKWGASLVDAAHIGASYDKGHGPGFYADAALKRITGSGVASNRGYELNAGGYIRAFQTDHSNLRFGMNVNLQAYEKNLRNFSLGQGGYFSPQQYVALSFPVTYASQTDRWKWSATVAPGFQSYSEDPSPKFPTDPARQGKLAYDATQSTEVSPLHLGTSRSGFGISGAASGEYRFANSASIGAAASLDTFGQYSEFKVGVFLKKTFGGP